MFYFYLSELYFLCVHNVMSAKEGLGPSVTYKEKLECRNYCESGSKWENMTHLTIMLGSGPCSEGSDSMLARMMPFKNIKLCNVALHNVFLR